MGDRVSKMRSKEWSSIHTLPSKIVRYWSADDRAHVGDTVERKDDDRDIEPTLVNEE